MNRDKWTFKIGADALSASARICAEREEAKLANIETTTGKSFDELKELLEKDEKAWQSYTFAHDEDLPVSEFPGAGIGFVGHRDKAAEYRDWEKKLAGRPSVQYQCDADDLRFFDIPDKEQPGLKDRIVGKTYEEEVEDGLQL